MWLWVNVIKTSIRGCFANLVFKNYSEWTDHTAKQIFSSSTEFSSQSENKMVLTAHDIVKNIIYFWKLFNNIEYYKLYLNLYSV